MKPSDKRFRLPIRLYDPATQDEHSSKSEFMKGYIRIKARDIESWEEYLHSDTPFSDVDIPQFTLLKMYNMEEILVSWDMKKFEEEYDKHIEKLLQYKRDKKELKRANKLAKKLSKQNKS